MKKILLFLMIGLNVAFGAKAYDYISYNGKLGSHEALFSFAKKHIEASELSITTDNSIEIYHFKNFDKGILKLTNDNSQYAIAKIKDKNSATNEIHVKLFDKNKKLLNEATLKRELSQYDLNEVSADDFKEADKKLNIVYKKVVKKYKTNKDYLEKLKISQRLWVKLRDANVEAKFPAKDKRFEYGSMYGLEKNALLSELTMQRVKFLESLL